MPSSVSPLLSMSLTSCLPNHAITRQWMWWTLIMQSLRDGIRSQSWFLSFDVIAKYTSIKALNDFITVSDRSENYSNPLSSNNESVGGDLRQNCLHRSTRAKLYAASPLMVKILLHTYVDYIKYFDGWRRTCYERERESINLSTLQLTSRCFSHSVCLHEVDKR